MCRLLGIIANKPVEIKYSNKRFKQRANADISNFPNPNGWGIGYYQDEIPKIEKEPIDILSSNIPDDIIKNLQSQIFLSHLRKRVLKNGERREQVYTIENTHPFQWNKWIFAHNGSVFKNGEDRQAFTDTFLEPEWKTNIQGQTDSEVYFYWLLQNIEAEKDIKSGIKRAMQDIYNQRYDALNFILTDGVSLYAYCGYDENYVRRRMRNNEDFSEDHYVLRYLERDPTNDYVMYNSKEDVKIMLGKKAERLEKAVLVCSEPLSTEPWKKMDNQTLLVVSSDLSTKIFNI